MLKIASFSCIFKQFFHDLFLLAMLDQHLDDCFDPASVLLAWLADALVSKYAGNSLNLKLGLIFGEIWLSKHI